jgi:hypothetical protein
MCLLSQDIPLDIIFEDEHLIVVNKRADMVVHPAAGHSSGTLVNALLFHCELPTLVETGALSFLIYHFLLSNDQRPLRVELLKGTARMPSSPFAIFQH